MKFNKNNFKSQTDEVLFILQNKKSVACVEFANKYGILRYGACIFNLRHWKNANWRRYKIDMVEKYVRVWKRIQRQVRYSLKK